MSLYPFEWLGKPRASLPKVKTGCVNCKKRHLKCDESKPVCNRCQKGKRDCVYQIQQVAVLENTSLRIQIRYPAPQSPPLLQHFTSESERCGFDSFRHMQAQVLGDDLGWSDWGSVVLRNSETDSALRHAIIALGAMYKEIIRTYGQTTVHRNLLPLAYKQCQRAIQILRTQLQNNMTTSMETKTLACMLLVVFDFLQGDDRAAAAHLFGGIAMLRNYLAKNQALETLLDRIMSPWRTSLDRSGTLPIEGSFGARLLLSYGYLDFWAFCWMDSLTALPEVSVLEGLEVKHLPRPGTEVNVSFQKFTPLENRIREFLQAARGRNLRKSHYTYQYSCASYHGVSPDTLSESTLLTCETPQSNDAMNTVVDMKTKLVELLSQWHTDFDLARSTCTDLEEILAAKVVAVNHKKVEIMLSASQADGPQTTRRPPQPSKAFSNYRKWSSRTKVFRQVRGSISAPRLRL